MASFTTSFPSTPEQASGEWSLKGSLLSRDGKPFVVLDQVTRGVYGTHLGEGTRTYWLELATGTLKAKRISVAWLIDEHAYALDSAFHELVGEVAERLIEIDSPVRFNESEGHRASRSWIQLLASALALILVIVVLFGLGGIWQVPVGLALLAGGIWWWRDSNVTADDALTPAELIDRVAPHVVRHSGD